VGLGNVGFQLKATVVVVNLAMVVVVNLATVVVVVKIFGAGATVFGAVVAGKVV